MAGIRYGPPLPCGGVADGVDVVDDRLGISGGHFPILTIAVNDGQDGLYGLLLELASWQVLRADEFAGTGGLSGRLRRQVRSRLAWRRRF
jgi:hypothetical protein